MYYKEFTGIKLISHCAKRYRIGPALVYAAVVVVLFLSSRASAVVVINDDFSDGLRSRTGALDLDWYSAGGTFSNNTGIKPLLTVVDDSAGSGTSSGLQSGNALRSEGGGSNSGEFIGRFPSTVTLGSTVGDKVEVSFDWRFDDADEAYPSQAQLRFGLFGDSDNEFGKKSILSPAGSAVNKQFADFDGDLDSDGQDFLVWLSNVGTSSGATLSDGDTNFDGAVDGLDLNDTITFASGQANENTVEYGWEADFGNAPVVWGESDGQFERCGSPHSGAPGTCGDLGAYARIQISDDAQWIGFEQFQPTGEMNRLIAEDNVNNILGGAGDNQTLVSPEDSDPNDPPPTPLTLQRNGIDISGAEYDDEAYIDGSVEKYHISMVMERAVEDPDQPGADVIYSLSITTPGGDVLLMESYEVLPIAQTDLPTPVEFDYVILNNVSANYDQIIDNFMVQEILAPSPVDAVPEPASLLTFSLGLLALTSMRPTKRAQ